MANINLSVLDFDEKIYQRVTRFLLFLIVKFYCQLPIFPQKSQSGHPNKIKTEPVFRRKISRLAEFLKYLITIKINKRLKKFPGKYFISYSFSCCNNNL
jgi:hypothetical protein